MFHDFHNHVAIYCYTIIVQFSIELFSNHFRLSAKQKRIHFLSPKVKKNRFITLL